MADYYWKGDDATTPNSWSVAGNWQTASGGAGSVPSATDNVFIEGDEDISAGLDQSAIALGTVYIGMDYTGSIGTHADGIDTPLQLDPNDLSIGDYSGFGSPNGSGRIILSLDSTGCDIVVHDSKTLATESTMTPVRLYVEDATASLIVHKGMVTLMNDDGTGTNASPDIASIITRYTTSSLTDVQLIVEDGYTPDLDMFGGEVIVRGDVGDTNLYAGSLVCYGDTTGTDLVIEGGDHIWRGALSTTNIKVTSGEVEFKGNVTITLLDMIGGTVTTREQCGMTTINTKGTLSMYGSDIITTLNVLEGSTLLNDICAITNLNIYHNGTLIADEDLKTKTFTNVSMQTNSSLSVNENTTLTNGIVLDDDTDLTEVTLSGFAHKTIDFS